MRKRWWWLLLVLLAWLVMPRQSVQAEGAGFTVTPVLPKNQLGGNTGWFNLLVVPGQEQELTVIVANQSAKTKRLRVALTNAYTQDNGQVGYAPNKRHDPSAITQLTAMGSKPVTVALAAHTGRRVTFRLTPPASGFPGQVLGAVYVQEQTESEPEAASGFAIANQFAMVVAVQLQTSPEQLIPELKLGTVAPAADAVVAQVRNIRARLFGKMTLTAKVVNAATKEVVLTQKNRDYQMAPNSALNYQLRPKQALAAGDYKLTIAAKAGDQRWSLARDFHLTATAAAKANPPEVQSALPWWWIGLPAVLLGLLVIWLLRRRKKGRE